MKDYESMFEKVMSDLKSAVHGMPFVPSQTIMLIIKQFDNAAPAPVVVSNDKCKVCGALVGKCLNCGTEVKAPVPAPMAERSCGNCAKNLGGYCKRTEGGACDSRNNFLFWQPQAPAPTEADKHWQTQLRINAAIDLNLKDLYDRVRDLEAK